MSEESRPRTDLWRFKQEVLDLPAEAALPSALSDRWLALLTRDLEQFFGDDEPAEQPDWEGTSAAAPMALMLHLLSSRANGKRVLITVDELERSMTLLRLELAIELVRRSTNLQIAPASLQTVLTNREVECVLKPKVG